MAKKAAIKIGAKTYYAATAATVTNALKNFSTFSYKAGSYTYKLTNTDMRHILTRHHPKYWDGTIKSKQTFLDPNLTVNQVRNIVTEVAKQNRGKLASKHFTNTQVEGTVNGVRYVLGLDRSGHFRQLYPIN